MARARSKQLAGIEYAGQPGISAECKYAVRRFLLCGERIQRARILTSRNNRCWQHALLLTVSVDDLVAIKSGFTSGYMGEGPKALSSTLALLDAHDIEIDEIEVAEQVIGRIELSALTTADIALIESTKAIRPTRWYGYVLEQDSFKARDGTVWEDFPPAMPLAIIDARLFDLAKAFWDAPDDRLLAGYRRLEDIVRKRIESCEHGAKLFSEAFLGAAAKLHWPDCNAAEGDGRANLFTAAYRAYRNPRAHRELRHEGNSQLVEFLLLNHLFVLEKEATECATATSSLDQKEPVESSNS